MKTFVAIFLLLSLYGVCNAQNNSSSTVDEKIKSKIQELHDKKTDTIICYYVNCIGGKPILNTDSCVSYQMKYLLWASNRKYFIQRFDECSGYKPLIIKGSFFNLLHQNYHKIAIGLLEYPKYTISVNGKKETYYTTLDHSCHAMFEIYIGNKVLEKDLDDYALETKYIDDKYRNLNYWRNKRSPLNKLKILAENEVALYNKKSGK